MKQPLRLADELRQAVVLQVFARFKACQHVNGSFGDVRQPSHVGYVRKRGFHVWLETNQTKIATTNAQLMKKQSRSAAKVENRSARPNEPGDGLESDLCPSSMRKARQWVWGVDGLSAVVHWHLCLGRQGACPL